MAYSSEVVQLQSSCFFLVEAGQLLPSCLTHFSSCCSAIEPVPADCPRLPASRHQAQTHSSSGSSTTGRNFMPQHLQMASSAQGAASAQSPDAQQDTASSSPVCRQFPLGHYQATVDQMRSCGYPLPLKGQAGQEVLPEGFVSTSHSGESPDEQPYSLKIK